MPTTANSSAGTQSTDICAKGTDPEMSAIITASASLVGLFLVLKGANSVKERAKQAKRFRKTYMTFVFEGLYHRSS